MISDNERIQEQRRRCLDKGQQQRPWRCALAAEVEALRDTEDEPSWQLRASARTKARVESIRFEIDDLELLVKRITPLECCNDDAYLESYPRAPGQTGHCAIDMNRINSVGVDGIRNELRSRIKQADGETRKTYQSFLMAADSLSTMIANAETAVLNAIAATEDDDRLSELKQMLASCARLKTKPPETFRDAIQLMWFVEMATMFGDQVGLVSPGHIDRVLGPFYERDMAAGILTRNEALLLIENLYIGINEFISPGGAIAVMVGGRNETGKDVTNELSYLALEALRRSNLVYPTVGVCWNEDTPTALTDLAIELIAAGYSTPAFFGDEVIQRGLQRYGMPPEESCNYINSTCVEITPVGSSNVWVASPYFSMCKLLREEMASAQCLDDFESFLSGYHKRVSHAITTAVAKQNDWRRRRRERGRKPLQSLFTRDCIDRGLDIDDGGARYNWVECSFVGIANLADCLHAIRTEVFEHNEVTMAELNELCKSNFQGAEPIRQRLLSHAKYGNGETEVDALVGEIVAFVQGECAKHRMEPDDSHFVPGAFCWIMHERLGSECGATPDGRLAGKAFADGAGPAQGREKNGPTAAILSTTSWDHSPMIGGIAYNMKFNSSLLGSETSLKALRELVLTYLRHGGFETQINVVSHEILKRAQESPEEYRDLVVRIGGYTDYFTRLSPGMQEEVMKRTEFASF